MKNRIIVNVKKDVNPQELFPAGTMSGKNDNAFIKPMYSVLDRPANVKYKADAEKMTPQELGSLEMSLINDLQEEDKDIYRTFVIELPDDTKSELVAEQLKNNSGVNYVQVDEINQLMLNPPNDPLFEQLYGHKLIQCEKAWDINQGEDIIVAVIDTGVDYNHADIKANMWKDANGNMGYNFSENTYDPMDYHSHGTHVSGTIASTGNNSEGIIGVAFRARIMAIKIFPNAYDSVCAQAIKFAVDSGAKVINNSWGPTSKRPSNPAVAKAIDYAVLNGVVVVFAAGNSADDVQYYAPANHPDVICVAATDSNDNLANFSNFGNNVTISAPGKDICSLKYRSTEYVYMSGTSMAAPHVSAVAALICSKYPGISVAEVKDRIRTNADTISTIKPAGSGRLNAYKAL
jgi:subtilisin family serine protease